MVYFTEKEKELTHGIYHDMADAVAAAVARRETAQPTVYVAAYMHRLGSTSRRTRRTSLPSGALRISPACNARATRRFATAS